MTSDKTGAGMCQDGGLWVVAEGKPDAAAGSTGHSRAQLPGWLVRGVSHAPLRRQSIQWFPFAVSE